MHIHTILGREDMLRQQDFQTLKAQHSEMLVAYRHQEWDKARKLVDSCRTADGSFTDLYDMYEERIAFYLENPPDPAWEGVYVAETK